MAHPLVLQLRFTRSEFLRGLEDLTEEEACRRFMPMNCISWNVGHLAWQEQRYWLWRAQGQVLLPDINKVYASGAPAGTPSLAEMLQAWRAITAAADPWLDEVTTEKLEERLVVQDKPQGYIYGSLLHRMIYHYWYHLGENLAIRQVLGHTDLPQFVGDIDGLAPYVAEMRPAYD